MQISTNGVDHPDYAMTVCDIADKNPTIREFNFKKAANNANDYCVSCGAWTVIDANEGGVSDLQHSSNLSPSYSVHTWLSVKTTLPGGRVVQECGQFQIQP